MLNHPCNCHLRLNKQILSQQQYNILQIFSDFVKVFPLRKYYDFATYDFGNLHIYFDIWQHILMTPELTVSVDISALIEAETIVRGSGG